MKKTIAFVGLASLIFAVSCGKGKKSEPSLGIPTANVLVQFQKVRKDSDWAIVPVNTIHKVVVLTEDGEFEIKPLNRDDANDRNLAIMTDSTGWIRAVCEDGHTFLGNFISDGVPPDPDIVDIYFFDVKKLEIRYIGRANTNLFLNPVVESALYANANVSRRNLSFIGDNLIVIDCNGNFAIVNECNFGDGCHTIAGGNVLLALHDITPNNNLDALKKAFIFKPISSEITSSRMYDSSGKMVEEIKVSDIDNKLRLEAQTNTHFIIAEYDSNNNIVKFHFVNKSDGTVKSVNQSITTNGNATTVAVSVGTDVYFAVMDNGSQNIFIRKFDGNNVSTIKDINATGQFKQMEFDGKGNFYYVDNNALNTIGYVKPDRTTGTATAAGNIGFMAGTTDGIFVNAGGTYQTYSAGGTVNNANGTQQNAFGVCENGTIYNESQDNMYCYDNGTANREISFVPNLANATAVDVGGSGGGAAQRQGDTSSAVYLTWNNFWYKCDIPNRTCSAMVLTTQDINTFVDVYSVVSMNSLSNRATVLSLVNDEIMYDFDIYPIDAPGFSYNADKMVDTKANPGDLCDGVANQPFGGYPQLYSSLEYQAVIGTSNGWDKKPIITYNIVPDVGTPIDCIQNVLYVW